MNHDDFLSRAGVSARDLQCSAEAATPQIIEALSAGVLEQASLASGFGLSGQAGIGKTGAMVALARAIAHRAEAPAAKPPPASVQEMEEQQRDRERPAPPWMLWLSWPDTVNRMRVLSMQDGGIAEVGRLVDRATRCAVLFLDDVGAERIKGTYIDDWAASQLDLIVDGRYHAMLPTWYTTGLDAKAIVDKYGRRLFSRLCSENRLISLPRLPDRRFAGASS